MFSKAPVIWIVTAAIWGTACMTIWCEVFGNDVFVVRTESQFDKAWTAFEADTNSTTAACEVGRTSSALATLATNDTQRAAVAKRGISVCRHLLSLETNSVPGHYYLAINLGQLAKAEAPSLSSYRLVHEVEQEFLTTARLDPEYDFAGPARALGQLYFQAPGWPLSIGSKSKSREWLERAAAIAPGYPGNQLNLVEAELKWRQREAVEATLKKMDAIWPAAKTNFVGEAWQESWLDWDTRRDAVKADYQRVYGTRP